MKMCFKGSLHRH